MGYLTTVEPGHLSVGPEPLGTLRDDCWSRVELRFEPAAVRRVPVERA